MTKSLHRALDRGQGWDSCVDLDPCASKELEFWKDNVSSLNSDLCLATICVTTYTAFLRYNELASLRCCDVSFCDSFVKIYVYKSKTDVYRDGAYVLLAKTGYVSCPFNLLRRYVSAANLDLSSSLPFVSLFVFS